MSLQLLLITSCSQGVEGSLAHAKENFQAGKLSDAELLFRKVLSTEPQNQEAVLGLAETLQRQGKFLEAWDAYKHAEKSAPNDLKILKARIEIGYTALRSGPSRMRNLEEEVQDLCRRALLLKPDLASALRTRAFLSMRLAEIAEARKDYEAAFAIAPEDPETFKALMGIWVNAGETDRAVAALREITAKHPRLEEAYQTLYTHFMRRQQFAEARGVLEAKHKVFGETSASALESAAHEERSGNLAAAQRILADLETKRPGTARYRLDLAEYHARFGRWDLALAEVEKGLLAFPAQKLQLSHEKSRLLNASGRTREAADLIAATYAAFPKESRLLLEEAQLRAALSEDEDQRHKADLLFTKLRALDPLPTGLEAQYIRFLKATQRSEEASAALAEAVKKYPGDQDLQLLQARQSLSLAAPGKALTFASKGFALRPSSPEAVTLVAECLIASGMPAEASTLLEDWKENNRPNQEVDIMLAGVYASQNQRPKAMQLLEKISKQKQSTSGQVTALAWAYKAVGEPQKAMSILETALRTSTRSASLLQAKANLLENDGKFKESLAIVKQLAETRPHVSPLLQIARLEGNLANAGGAAEAINQAEALAPNHPEVRFAKAGFLESQSRHAAAEKLLRALFTAEPRSARFANALAWNLTMQGRAAEAKPIAAVATKEDPNDLNFQDTAAWIAFKLKEFNQAKTAYQALIRADKKNPSFHYHFVETLIALKDPMAKSEYAKATTKGTIPPECRDIALRIHDNQANSF